MATTTHLDVRGCQDDRCREQLFDALAERQAGDTVAIVADRDVDPDLIRYQLEHDRALDWEYATPDGEPRELRLTVGGSLGETDLAAIDVRDLKPQRRHEALLEIFDELAADEGFLLVNDHDPKPLYHELRSMHGDVVEWEYASRESGEWRVEVRKTGDSAADDDDDIVTRYDVRDIPKQERHPTIHHRYGMLPEGGTMELVAPHEPRPLRREFRQRYGGTFTWTVVDAEPGRCRVRITKAADADAGDGADESGEPPGDADDGSTSAEADDGPASANADDEPASANADDEPASANADDEPASAKADPGLEIIEELDVRDLPPAQRHEQIFEAYAELQRGEAFVLVNDHDPKPLYHQFEAEAGDEFRWDYQQREPGEFRVRIGQSDGTGDPTGTGSRDVPF